MSDYFSGFVLPDRAGAALRKMIDSGLFGDGESEVLSHISLVAIQDAISRSLIEAPDLDLGMDDIQEAPEPRFKCTTCEDGMVLPENKLLCPDCGNDGIPF